MDAHPEKGQSERAIAMDDRWRSDSRDVIVDTCAAHITSVGPMTYIVVTFENIPNRHLKEVWFRGRQNGGTLGFYVASRNDCNFKRQARQSSIGIAKSTPTRIMLTNLSLG